MTLVNRKIRRLAVDRCGGSSNNFFYAVPHCRFENAQSSADSHFNRLPRHVRPLRDSQCCLVENIIHSFASSIDQRSVSDIALDHVRAARLEGRRQIAPSAANKIVEYPNFRRSGVKKLVNDGTPYESSATSDQKPCTRNTI